MRLFKKGMNEWGGIVMIVIAILAFFVIITIIVRGILSLLGTK